MQHHVALQLGVDTNLSAAMGTAAALAVSGGCRIGVQFTVRQAFACDTKPCLSMVGSSCLCMVGGDADNDE
jgi:hypothetical protein